MSGLILTEGGEKIGFGHISRTIGLRHEFVEEGFNVKLIVNGDRKIYDVLENEDFEINNWLGNTTKLIKNIKKYNFVIIDSYLAEEEIYHLISKEISGKLLMIDDCNRIDYPSGVVVNPSIYGRDLKYAIKKDVIYLMGRN